MDHQHDKRTVEVPAAENAGDVVLAQTKQLRRRLWIVLGCVILAVALAVGIYFLVRLLTDKEEPSFRFYPITDESIYENPVYMGKDRELYYTDRDGVTERIDATYLQAYPNAELQLMYDYVHAIIEGDSAHYNVLFSRTYYEDAKPREDFTQQMLYDIALSVYNFDTAKDGTRLVTYRLEYDIYRNNGTYRNDCAPGKESPEFITLGIAKDGTVSIERRTLYREARN